MLRTQSEIRELAETLVNKVLAETISEFPAVRKAVDRVAKREWMETMDNATAAVEEILLDKFGSSD